MTGRLFDEVVIAAPGNLEPVRVPIASIQASWGINEAGAFSGFIRLADVRAAGLPDDIKGYWLAYASEAGPWGGVVTGQPTTGGVMEIVAQGYLGLVQGRVITQPIVAMGGSAGGLARRALSLAGAGTPTFLAFGTIDEGGGALAMELTGDVALDILPQIAEAGDVEWVIDAARVFHLARRLGADRSAWVRLVEDRHIVQPRVNDDLESLAAGQGYRVQGELSQDLLAATRPRPAVPAVQPPTNPAVPAASTETPVPPRWEPRGAVSLAAATARASLPEGIPAGAGAAVVGRSSRMAASWQQQRQTYEVEAPGVATAPASNAPPPPWAGLPPGVGANHPAVLARRHAPPPTVPAELTLAPVDGCFAWCGLGDTVRIDLGSTGVSGRFRILTRGLDVATRTLTVAGELLRDG